MNKLHSKSSGYKDSNLGKENSRNSMRGSSSGSILLLDFVWNGISEVNSVDSTSTIDYFIRIVAQVHDQMYTGIEHNTIQRGGKIDHS